MELAKPNQTEDKALELLREGLFLVTKCNGFANRPKELYLGKEYRPEFDIDELLGDRIPPSLLLSDKYIDRQGGNPASGEQSTDLENWRGFFIRLGVRKSPRIIKCRDGDWECSPELQALLEADDPLVRRKTLECLDANWSEYDGSKKITKLHPRYTETDASFIKQLRACRAPTREDSIVTLDQTYYDVADVRGFFGEDADFVDASLQNDQFKEACGISYRVDVNACLKRLRHMRDKGGNTPEQIRDIYQRLEIIWKIDKTKNQKVWLDIRAAFESESLIAVWSGPAAEWKRAEEVCWKSTKVKYLDERYPTLEAQYADQKWFFIQALSIPEELSAENIIDELSALTNIHGYPDRKGTVFGIYGLLRHETNKLGVGVKPSWLFRLHREALLLNHRGQFVRNSDSLYVNDEPEMAKLFDDSPSIQWLDVPPNRLSGVQSLFDRVGVRKISSALKIEVASEVEGHVNEELTRKLREMTGCIARFMYHRNHEKFEDAVRNNRFDELRLIEVLEVPELVLDVTLGMESRRTTDVVANRGLQILLQSDAPSPVDHIAEEVRKLLDLKPENSDIISRLLMAESAKAAEDFLLRIRKIEMLPPDVAKTIFSGEISDLAGVAPEARIATASNTNGQVGVAMPTTVSDPDKPSAAPRIDGATNGRSLESPGARSEPEPKGAIGANPSHGVGTTIGDAGTQTNLLPHPSDTIGIPPVAMGNMELPNTNRRGEEKSTVTPLPSSSPGGTKLQPLSIYEKRSKITAKRERLRQSRPMRNRQGRLLSYAELNDSKQGDPRVEKAAVQFFLETAADCWQSLREMLWDNPGFDIQAVAFDGSEEVIEIKGLSGGWTAQGVALTPNELIEAHKRRDRYWLCVVEYATDNKRRQLSLVKDPFGLTQKFCFDNGWKALSINATVTPQRPEPGMFVQVPGEGKGRILKVKSTQRFAKLDIQFEDGTQIFRKVFIPGKMALSFD